MEPVLELGVAVQRCGSIARRHFLLELQLFTGVLHELDLRGATEHTAPKGGAALAESSAPRSACRDAPLTGTREVAEKGLFNV